MDTDYHFYSRRAAEETARAVRALTPAARELHEQLAATFAARARAAEHPDIEPARRSGSGGGRR